jgi:predicted esterase
MPFRALPLLGLLAAGLCAVSPAAETPVHAALTIHPASDGSLTFWLISPVLSVDTPPAEAPKDAREGQPVLGGTWKLYQTDLPYTNLSKELNGAQRGAVWCCARFRSGGGKRTMAALSPLTMRVFLNGNEVIHKKAASPGTDEYSTATVDVPKGVSEVAVLAGVKFGQSLFRFAMLEGPSEVAADDDEWLLPTADAPAAGGALGRALSIQGSDSFLHANKGPTLTIALRGSRPAFASPLTVRVFGADGKALPIDFPPRTGEQIQRAAWQVDLPPLQSDRAVTELACEILSGDEVLDRKTLRFYERQAVQREAQTFAQEVQTAVAKAGRRLPLAELTAEKLALVESDPAVDGGPPSPATSQFMMDLIENGRTLLATEAEGRDPRTGQTGYFERAYISRIDDSPQPYLVLAPSAAAKSLKGEEKDRRFPLVLFLHGYVPDYNKLRWWTEMPEFHAVFEKNDCFLAIPFGRSNADFLGPGEVDVIDVLNEMKRLYPIDEQRVYLYGYSMGGMGVYSIAGHYPHLWAGAIVLAGHAGSPLAWYTPGLDQLAPFKQHLIRTDQALDQCENFAHIPFQIFHGAQDRVVKPEGARTMQARIREIGGQADLTFLPGDHWSLFDLMVDELPVKKMLARKRPETFDRFRRVFHSLTFGDAVLFRVMQRTGGLAPFEIEWMKKDGGTYEIHQLKGPVGKLGDWSLPADQPVRWPSKEIEDRFADRRADLRAVGGPFARKDAGSGKSPFRCGPVKEATYGPFIVTYGTIGGEASTAKCRTHAEDFARWWFEFAKGRVAVKADREVTAEDRTSKSLFIFGEEQEHALHAEAAAKLPFQVKDGTFTVGERSVTLTQRGVMYLYPSPFAGAQPHCSLVIVAGAPYGLNLPVNHRLDLVPDFLLFESAIDTDGTKTNKPVLAGFFGGDWKLDPATTWWSRQE